MSENFRNSSWLAFQYVFTIISALISLKINIQHFGEVIFGTWVLLAAIWGFGNVMDLGFATSVIKYIAEYNRYNKNKINELISSTLVVFLVVGTTITVVGLFIAEMVYLNNSKIINVNQYSFFKLVFIYLSIAFFLRYITLYFKAIFEGFSNFVFTSKVSFIYNVLILFSAIFASLFNLSLIYLSFFYILSAAIVLSIYIIKFKIEFKLYSISIYSFNYKLVKKILSFSFSIQLSTILSALIDPIIKYLLGNYYNLGFISIYEIARRFAIAISNLFFTAFKTILPKASVLINDNDKYEFLINESASISKLGSIYSGIFFGIFPIFIGVIAKYWFGFDEVILVFIILALAESVNSFGFSLYNFYLGIGKANYLAIIQLSNLVITVSSLLISLLLFNSYIGIIGYYFSVIIGNIFMIVMARNKYKISPTKVFINSKAYKIIILDFLLFMNIVIIVSSNIDPFIPLSIMSLLSLGIFGIDIKYLFIKITSLLKLKM